MAESTSLAESAPVSGDDLAARRGVRARAVRARGRGRRRPRSPPGTARRRALDAALAEIDAGHEEPSVEWRREYSLILGLERLLVRGGAQAGRRHDALRPPGRRALGHADRAHRRGPGRAPSATATATARRRADVEELPSGEVEIEGDEELADEDEPLDWDEAEEAEEEAAADAVDEGPRRRPPLLVRARHRRRQDRRRARLRRGLAHRRRADPHPPPQPRRPVQRRAGRPRLQEARRAPAARRRTRTPTPRGRSPSRPTSGSCATPARSPTRTRSSSATRPTRRSARRRSASIRKWQGPIFVGMTATGALIARHVTDLFPTQTSRFDLAQAARRGVIAPLRCVRIPPGVGVRSISKVPLRKGEVDQDFDQEELAALLDQTPFNLAIADLYKARFKDLPGVVYSAGVRHAHNVADGFQDAGHQGEGRLGRDAQARAHPHPRRLRARRDRRARATPSCSPRAGTRRAPPSACTSRRPPRGGSTSSASAA